MKTKTKMLIAAGVAIFFAIGESHAQTMQLSWSARHGSSTGVYDKGNVIKVDASGNSFVGGTEAHSAGNGQDMILIKYNSSGTIQWHTVVNGTTSGGSDLINDIAIDGSGNIYATGILNQTGAGNEMGIVKFNSAGTAVWSYSSGTSSTDDRGFGIEIGSDGYIYVCGQYNNDAALWKYDSNGTLQTSFPATYNGSGSNNDVAYDLIFSSNYIYVCGLAYNSSGNADGVLLKYNTSGTLQAGFPALYNGAGSGFDAFYNLKKDLDYVYCCGQVYTSASVVDDGLLCKYNLIGTFQWAAIYNGAGNLTDGFNDLDLDGTGNNPNIYCTGTAHPTTTAGDLDYATVKYNSSGVQQWATLYDGPASSATSGDIAYDVAVSPYSGKIWVTGSTTSSNALDITTVRYTTAGVQDWAGSYNHTANLDEATLTHNCLFIAYDGCHPTTNDLVFVTGHSQTSALDYDIVTLKYIKTGVCTEGPGGEGRYGETGEEITKTGLYPNPFGSSATLAVNTELINATLNIYDLYGKLISSTPGISSAEIIIERGRIVNGIYFYQLVDNENLITFGKMIVQ